MTVAVASAPTTCARSRTTSTPATAGRAARARIAASPPATASSPATPRSVRWRPTAFDVETVSVEVQRSVGRNVFTPGYPTTAFAPARRPRAGRPAAARRAAIRRRSLEEGKGYQITADISNATEAMLAGAGTAYPPEIVATYLGTTGVTQRTADAGPPGGRRRRRHRPVPRGQGAGRLPAHRPALHLLDRGGAAVRPEPRPGRLLPVRPATGRSATASTSPPPWRSWPARSGCRLGWRSAMRRASGSTTAIYQYRERNAHAWAEIFFPGYGWQIFEATKSIAPVVRAAGAGDRAADQPRRRRRRPRAAVRGGDDPGVVSDAAVVPAGRRAASKPGDQRPTERGPQTATPGSSWRCSACSCAVAAWRLLRRRHRFRFLAPGRSAVAAARLRRRPRRALRSGRPRRSTSTPAGWRSRSRSAASRSTRSRTARSGRATRATRSRPRRSRAWSVPGPAPAAARCGSRCDSRVRSLLGGR